MAKITVKVTGGNVQELQADTVADVKEELNLPEHTVTVNGEAVDDDYELEDYEFVVLTEPAKGGR